MSNYVRNGMICIGFRNIISLKKRISLRTLLTQNSKEDYSKASTILSQIASNDSILFVKKLRLMSQLT